MKFGWLLFFLQVSVSEEYLSKNDETKVARSKRAENMITQRIWHNTPSKAAGKVRNQRTGFKKTDLGAAKENLLMAVRPTTGESKGKDAKMTQPAKLVEVEVAGKEVKDKKVSTVGIFLKLMTRGLLKGIVLPAIVRLGLFN